ncbi:HAD family hydrolase [Burkholderia multivorans]|uniref:Haloacid dehalogenase n=1 Tax=Burkholderia multivorans TaxID=87883 RepID=A0AB37ANL7_9BURK|nr:HAD-IA family hydrolase [Burkholderia multivorans]MBU9589631.1 HAD-IA family hydrolase [Burkholderia multivorans]PRE39294.1 haloacid dehalogenase [Burkholderia multivorans]PRE42285.1 haloacid dehalogenase [Burkholderia multivorans]
MAALTLLFDLDGTLVDTDALHLNAYNALLSRWNRSISVDYYKAHIMGFPDNLIYGGLFPEMAEEKYAELAVEKERLFRAQLTATLTPTAGTEDILAYGERVGARTAVVTNAPRENATMMLNALGLAKRFETLVIGGELEHGKPHPMPYLTALEFLGATAGSAIAFEDSISGVRSASSAGIFTFGMSTALDEARLREAGAQEVIGDFRDRTLWNLLESYQNKF